MADDVKRGNLRKMIDEEGIIPPLYAVDIARQILKAVVTVHGWGAGHGGVRPQNITIEKTVAVRDDGKKRITYRAEMAAGAEAEKNSLDIAATALRYRPPEMLQGTATTTPSADLYAVGVLLYEMTTGTPPFGIELPSELNPVIPQSLDRLVKKAMSHDQRLRHRTAEEMTAELDRVHDEIVRQLVTTRKSREESAHAAASGRRGGLKDLLHPVVANRETRWILLSLGVAVAMFAILMLLVSNGSPERVADPDKPDIVPYRAKIATVPPGAEVVFDGTKIGVTPQEFHTLEHKPHSVRLSMPYHDEKLIKLLPDTKDGRKIFRFVEEAAGRETEIANPSEIVLTRQKANLSIDCDTVKEVDIAIDGKPVGKTPGTFETIDAGIHTIILAKEGYVTLTKEIVLSANETSRYTYALLKMTDGPPPAARKTWSIWLKSVPEDAKVSVDGVEREKTPVFLRNLDAGVHQIRVEKKYYRPVEEKRMVDADLELNFELKRIKGSVRVETQPAGAVVYVDGVPFGPAPTTIHHLEGGAYKIRAVLDGYREASREVEIAAEEQFPVSFSLERLPLGALTVASAVPAPHVRVNGLARGATPLELQDLRPGKYTIRIFDVVKSVDVKPGETASVAFTLDDLEMVRVPAGDFVMGNSEGNAEERPRMRITLDAYYVDRHEVSNRKYRMFLDDLRQTNDHSRCHPDEGQGKNHTPEFWNGDTPPEEQHPVVGVDWFDCYAYAAWAGKRLPTEAEWEKAARGDKGNLYPWGFQWGDAILNWGEEGRKDGFKATAPVDGFSDGKSPYGCLNMAGNVWEWVGDWYDSGYYRVAPKSNPPGPANGVFKVLRGGSFLRSKEYHRCSVRHYSSILTRLNDSGFRCAMGAGKEK